MKWEKVKLGDIATCIQPGPFGSQLHNSDYSKEGTPIIMPKDIVGGAIVHSGLLKVSEEHVKRLSRHQVYEGNLMVARKGDVRKCAYITANENGWMTGSDCLKVVLDESKCYPKFIYYQLRSEHIGRWLEKVSIGATMPSLNTGLLSGIEMVLPPIEIQKQIAGILSVYDDLIENNQKQIKLLEEAAQRLYKEWFVDLHFPGHENTKIVDGVPEEWRVASIADICDTVGGGTPSTKIQSYYEKGDILWVTPTDITRNFSLALLDTEKKITPEGLKNSSAKILPAETILMTSRASVGFFGMCKYEVCTNQGFISCIPKRENLQMYLLFNLKSRVEEIRQKAGGSTYLEISKTVFRELKIILPKDEVLAEYQKNVHDIFDEIYCRTEMIKSLVDMRNRLLPKLMSGEVEV